MTTAIFIDGGYIAEITKNLGIRIDFERLRDYVKGKTQLYRTYYYYCMPFQSAEPSAEESTRYSKASKFIERLRQIPDFEVKLGKIQRVYNKEFHKYEFNQKMVDVMIAVDIVKLSIEKTITRAILMAGDSDFVYAIEIAKQYGIDIELYYYRDHKDHSDNSNYINDDLFNAVTEPKLMNSHFFEKCQMLR